MEDTQSLKQPPKPEIDFYLVGDQPAPNFFFDQNDDQTKNFGIRLITQKGFDFQIYLNGNVFKVSFNCMLAN